MLPLFLLVMALLVGLYALGRAFVGADPRVLAQGVRYGGTGLAAAVFLFLTVRGELGPALVLGSFLVPLMAYTRRRGASRGRAAAGQSSQVETLYLRMVLDHDTGAMTGTVLYGSFAGRGLDTLAPGELAALLDECGRQDAPSAAVLEAWLDRNRPDWRERFAGAGGAAAGDGGGAGARAAERGGLTRDEAYQILGLEPGATAEQVKEAHRRLMMGVHPDHGGSTYLAAKINQAKDLLLRS